MKKGIVKLVAIGICGMTAVASVAFTGTNTFASTNGKTAENAIAWVKSKVGTGIDYDGAYGNQCVDLIKAYYAYLGVMAQRGNGADYSWNTLPSGWSRLRGAQPRKGDVLVFTGGYNGYGHVAIYETDYSTYHQNYNGHSYVERVTYKYNSGSYIKYWGVIRPDFAVSKTLESSSGTSSSQATTTAFSGVKYYNGTWTYFKNGKADYSYTGVAKSTTGNWVFVRKGKFDKSYTGVAKSTTGNWVFVKNGKYTTSYTGVAKSTTGNWVFVKNGRYTTSYTGVAKSTTGNWVFVKNGRYTTSYTGVAKSTTGNWVFVKNGRYTTSYTGVAKSTTGNWVYVNKGRYDTSFTGISKVWNSSKKYYVVKGRWKRDFTGKYKGYNIKNGIVV